MANWIYNAKQDLIEYQSLLQALENIPDQIKELETQITGLKGVQYDKTPVQGGMSRNESRIIDYIDRKERLKINLLITESKVKRIKKGMQALNPKEKSIIDGMIINKGYGHLDRLCDELGYEKSAIYNMLNAGLAKFTLAMYGIKDI